LGFSAGRTDEDPLSGLNPPDSLLSGDSFLEVLIRPMGRFHSLIKIPLNPDGGRNIEYRIQNTEGRRQNKNQIFLSIYPRSSF
jgi:hypothetical protein